MGAMTVSALSSVSPLSRPCLARNGQVTPHLAQESQAPSCSSCLKEPGRTQCPEACPRLELYLRERLSGGGVQEAREVAHTQLPPAEQSQNPTPHHPTARPRALKTIRSLHFTECKTEAQQREDQTQEHTTVTHRPALAPGPPCHLACPGPAPLPQQDGNKKARVSLSRRYKEEARAASPTSSSTCRTQAWSSFRQQTSRRPHIRRP